MAQAVIADFSPCRTKWHWDRLSQVLWVFPLSIAFHHCSICIHSSFIHSSITLAIDDVFK